MGNSQVGMCNSEADLMSNRAARGMLIPEGELNEWLADVKSNIKKQVEDYDRRVERYIGMFSLTSEQLRVGAEAFTDELRIGLNCHKAHPLTYVESECSFKMSDSHVPRPPSGQESGVYYALDFGGTNFRAVRVEMKDGQIKQTQMKAALSECACEHPKGLMDPAATATQMFDFFADVTKRFMEEEGDIDSASEIPCGFCFSYPCMQRKVDNASLIVWTKGFETGRETNDPVEGCNAATLMNNAFQRKDLPIRVNSVVNDTVGTLLSCGYALDSKKPPCGVGLILGTGMNAAYTEPHAEDYGYEGSIINIECGNFNRDLPSTNIDFEVDFADVGGRGRQHLEKMVAGNYLGEIVRRTLVKIMQYRAPPELWAPYRFTSEDASAIIGDKSEQLIVVSKITKDRFEHTFTSEELKIIQRIARVVFERAAALSAMLIAGCVTKSGRIQEAMGGITVGIDGSLYKHNKFFQDDVRKFLEDILGKEQADLVHLEFAEDGSGLGAGILSAIVEQT